MEDGPNRPVRWIKMFILYVIAVSGVVAPFSSAQCVDGTYKHDGRDCCLCPAGQYLVEHCTTNLQNGKCELCQAETYSSEPSYQVSCEPCTSCLHHNDNLEEEEPCTPARNRKCRCRQDHYCSSTTEICRLCNPCTICDPEGIKLPCTANNDTVCNDKNTGGKTAGIITGVFVAAGLIFVGVFVYIRQKRKRLQLKTSTNANDEAMQSLKEVNLHPYLPDIADIIGWRDMKRIAISTNISSVTIDSIRLDNPGDSQEQTLQLLRRFIEKHSREASQMLIVILKEKGKNDKADRVQRLLASPARAVESA